MKLPLTVACALTLVSPAQSRGIALWKEQEFHADNLARVITYDKRIPGRINYRFESGGKVYSLAGTFFCIDFIDEPDITVTSEEEARLLTQRLIELRAAAKKYPQAATLLASQITLLEVVIERFGNDVFTCSGQPVSRRDFLAQIAPIGQPGNSPQDLPDPDTERNAKAGNPQAQLAWGKYLNNLGKRDEAIVWLERAAVNKLPAAQYELGKVRYAGKPGDPGHNPREAARWLTKAALNNHSGAQLLLSDCFLHGTGVARNDELSFQLALQALKNGCLDACIPVFEKYMNGTGVAANAKQAISALTYGADRGNSAAQFRLAECFFQGNRVEQDYSRAAELLAKSAASGNPDAHALLGICFYCGYGVKANAAKAYDHLLRGQSAANPLANYLMVQLALERSDFKQRQINIIQELRNSATAGIVQAQHDLAACLENGFETERNLEEAARWYLKAAQQGYLHSQLKISEIYHAPDSPLTNSAESAKWLKLAADTPYAPAQYALALRYFAGDGVEVNQKEGVKYLQLASQGNHADATCDLANCYYEGLGVAKDLGKAVEFYRLAARQGSAAARQVLASMNLD